jgi:hypothetical protein
MVASTSRSRAAAIAAMLSASATLGTLTAHSHFQQETHCALSNSLVPGPDRGVLWNMLMNPSVRTRFGLPQVPPDSIAAITDSATCRRAALAFGRNLSPPDTVTGRAVLVIRIGRTHYSVSDGVKTTRYSIHMVFDSSFATLLGQYGS